MSKARSKSASRSPSKAASPPASPPPPEQKPSVRDHPHSRVIAHFTTEFILRSAENISGRFDHDYEAAVLFLTISNRNAEKVMIDPALREQYASFKTTIPPEHTLYISRLGLARATGLPRETVRRKVAQLIAKGWIIETEGGLRVHPDLNRQPQYVRGLEPQAQNLRRLFTMLWASGAFGAAQTT